MASKERNYSFREFLKLQLAEMLGPDNMYYAGLELGHQPTVEEAIRYYIEHGGADRFRQKWEECHPSGKKRLA